MNELDFTHDVKRQSWVSSAQAKGTDFPIQNLPYAVFRQKGAAYAEWRGGVAIGDQVLCLASVKNTGLLSGLAQQACEAAAQKSLNLFLSMGPEAWKALRHALSTLLCDDLDKDDQKRLKAALFSQQEAEFNLPATVGDYTDFYTSIDHARNIGLMRRPDNPLSPNFQWIPIAYHGRVSTLGVSGQRVRRPHGQVKLPHADMPELKVSSQLDYELELGLWIGTGNDAGAQIGIEQAVSHVFGISVLNDWSARDLQRWEMAPLGPFLAKNFATTVSPWVVTMDALLPYRLAWDRASDEPQPLAYLEHESVRKAGAYDIQLQVRLQSSLMRERQLAGQVLAQTNFRHQYWSIAQMVTQHTVNGCSLRPGDLLGTGTISGPSADQAGSMLELAQDAQAPFTLCTGEQRSFLEDGDLVEFSAWCSAPHAARIGFGVCTGTIEAAL